MLVWVQIIVDVSNPSPAQLGSLGTPNLSGRSSSDLESASDSGNDLRVAVKDTDVNNLAALHGEAVDSFVLSTS